MLGQMLATVALATGFASGAPLAFAASPERVDASVATLALTASGEARASPDMASFTAGVRAQAVDARQAQSASASKMTAVIAALTKSGIAARDLQSADLTLAPQYATPPDQPPRLTGYVASASVEVRVRDLRRLAPAIDAAAAAGADTVDGIVFGLADPETAQNAARRDAMRRLAAEATVYAQAAGLRLGRLMTLTADGVDPVVRPRPYLLRQSAMKSAATPIEPGELTVRAQVAATYQLQP